MDTPPIWFVCVLCLLALVGLIDVLIRLGVFLAHLQYVP